MVDLNESDYQECMMLHARLASGRSSPDYCVWFRENTNLYMYSFESARLAIAASRIFLAAGADPTIRSGPENLTPFENAVRYQRWAVVRFYVEEGHQIINDSNRERFFAVAARGEEEARRRGASASRIDEEHSDTVKMRSLLTELEIAIVVANSAENTTERTRGGHRSLNTCL